MKVCFFLSLLLFFSTKAFCQCPTWIGASIENAKELKPLIQKHLQVTFKDVPDTIDAVKHKSLAYKDKKEFTIFSIGWYVKKSSEGSNPLPPLVNNIQIKGPAEKVDKLINEMGTLAQKCPAYSRGSNWIKISNFIIGWGDTEVNNGTPMKYITIKPIVLK